MLGEVVGGLLLRRAFHRYARRLGPQLLKDYGGGGIYSTGQIRTAIHKTGLSPKFIEIGFAAFQTEDDFIQSSGLTAADYKRIRERFHDCLPWKGGECGPAPEHPKL